MWWPSFLFGVLRREEGRNWIDSSDRSLGQHWKMYEWVIDSRMSEFLLLAAEELCGGTLLHFLLISLLFSHNLLWGFFGRTAFLSKSLIFILLSWESRITTGYSYTCAAVIPCVLIKPVSFERLKDYMLLFRRINRSPFRLFCKPHLYSSQIFCLLEGREVSHAKSKYTNTL